MGFLDWARILIPTILLLLFPTALLFMVTSPTSPTSTGTGTGTGPLLVQPQRSQQEAQVTNASLVPAQRKKAKAASVVEEGLARARWSIRRAAGRNNASALLREEIPLPRIYRNPSAFYQSYTEMERRLKVYVYEEGEPPLVHDGPCKNIYTTEGRFIHELETMKGGRLRTKDPRRAHVFFLPFSVAWMVRYIFQADGHYNHDPLKRFVSDYIRVIGTKHPYWNRSSGADHFMLSCHDWGPSMSTANPELYNNAIHALCNANTSEGFRPEKDVSIPEIHLLTGEISPFLLNPVPPDSPRPYLAFFAGGMHGPIRPILLREWGAHRDPDMQVHQYLPKGVNYYKDYMLRSRFCLCTSGYEVASPRLVEAIYAECVPVLIKKGYSAPFGDVLRYEEFSVTVEVEDIPRLKEILNAVSDEEVERLREGARAVRRHFVLNHPPERFDVFHMILHSVWLRRLNVKVL